MGYHHKLHDSNEKGLKSLEYKTVLLGATNTIQSYNQYHVIRTLLEALYSTFVLF